MTSMLSKATEEIRREAADVYEDLVATLAVAEIPLPSVAVDWQAAYTTGVVLIDLGAAPPQVIRRLVEVIRKGVRA
ncbi:hypothetical protein [Kitasatospora sp. NPDC093806]|uniref:hypothetical protein n=1 Tax=Kitasatospora sp. NPDC093806 TaxID=3155075 RepID=UPI00341C94F3